MIFFFYFLLKLAVRKISREENIKTSHVFITLLLLQSESYFCQPNLPWSKPWSGTTKRGHIHTIIVCLSPRSEFICSNRKADFVIKVIYSTKHSFFISKHHMEIKYKISAGWINDNILQRWGIKSAKNPQVMRMTPPKDSLEMLLRK